MPTRTVSSQADGRVGTLTLNFTEIRVTHLTKTGKPDRRRKTFVYTVKHDDRRRKMPRTPRTPSVRYTEMAPKQWMWELLDARGHTAVEADGFSSESSARRDCKSVQNLFAQVTP